MKSKLTFKPRQVVSALISGLSKRSREVIEARYGLGKSDKPLTLEAIGKKYGITRERVRQVEAASLVSIRKSDAYKKQQSVFDELALMIDAQGAVVLEEDFLLGVASDKVTQNAVHFLLVLGDSFQKQKEDVEFHKHWYIEEAMANKIRGALRTLYDNLADDALVAESELVSMFLESVQDLNQKYCNEEIARRWLSMSKNIGKNPLGEWGRAESSSVRVKGMRDYAYLVIKRHGSPMHFKEVAKAITELFSKKAHEATCHNELIKDKRFVLVGRGLYALEEWGYQGGVVKDVIQEMIREQGPLSKEEILDKVRRERYVKDNTILVNLQDTKIFKRTPEGLYTVVK
jgi:hypothetical protein